MKQYLYCLLFFLFLFMAQVSAQGVGISENNDIPDPNAILDIKSSAKGVLLPRTSAGSRFAIPATKG